MSLLLLGLLINFIGLLLGLVVWGWARWFNGERTRNVYRTISTIGLSLSTISALMIIASIFYLRNAGLLVLFDSFLFRLSSCGAVLSVSGTILSMIGLRQQSPFRWNALFSGIITLAYWIFLLS